MSDVCKYVLKSPDAFGESTDLVIGKNSEEGLSRIQALIAEWLGMENVVVLTGSGCSVDAGGRVMKGSRNISLEHLVLDAVLQCPLSDAAKAILQWRVENSSGEGNFEEWLSYLFNMKRLTEANSSPIKSVDWKQPKELNQMDALSPDEEDQKQLCCFLERAIFAECALEIDRNELTGQSSTKPSGHFAFLAKLTARDKNLGRVHLFTLNYDTLF